MQIGQMVQSEKYDDTSLVVIDQGGRGRKPRSEQKRTLAARAGVRFVRLVHKEWCPTDRGMSCFQHVHLVRSQRPGGGWTIVTKWAVEEYDGKTPIIGHTCVFAPNELGDGVAYVPISPHNMAVLATHIIFDNALYTIDDKEVEAEAKALAEKIKASPEHKKAMEDLKRVREEHRLYNLRKDAATQTHSDLHKNPYALDNAVLEQEVKLLEDAQRNKELKERLARAREAGHITESGELVRRDDATEPETETGSSGDSTVVHTVDMKAVQKQARKQIEEENPEEVKAFKADYKKQRGRLNGWSSSRRYRDQFGGRILARAKEIANADTGSGNMA